MSQRTAIPYSLLGPLASVLLGWSCGLDFRGPPQEFALSDKSLAMLADDDAGRSELEAGLTRHFGTSTAPSLVECLPQSLSTASLASAADLYRQKCEHCHGASGGGDGRTSHSLRPPPRDFRLGIFKFTSLLHGARPEIVDLRDVLDNGIEGAAMPSFRSLPDEDRSGLAAYVQLLSMRGETEHYVLADYEMTGKVSSELVDEAFQVISERWSDPSRQRVVGTNPIPAESSASVARGRELYNDSAGANCVSCHGRDGRGEGPSSLESVAGDPAEVELALVDIWGHPSRPTDLVDGPYLHGVEPLDIYRRIVIGVPGTPMPGLGEDILSDADMWSLVHYVRFLHDPTIAPHLPLVLGTAP